MMAFFVFNKGVKRLTTTLQLFIYLLAFLDANNLQNISFLFENRLICS